MITLQSAARDANIAGNINSVYSGSAQATSLDVLTEEITLVTGDANGSAVDFVPFTRDVVLDLKNSMIYIDGLITNVLSNTVKLQKVIGIPEVFSATLTSGSTAVTSSKKGLLVGQSVTGTGVAASTTIAAITATGFTLSANATASGTVDVTVTGAADITAAATVAATAATASTAAQAVPFVAINGGIAPLLAKKGDRLRFVLVAVTSLGIGRVLVPMIPYMSRLAPGLTP